MGRKNNCNWPVGILDIGSNTLRLVVFDNPSALKPSFNSKVYCHLGRGMEKSKKLSVGGRRKALDAIAGFHQLSRAMGVGTFAAFATAAVRDAKNGKAFVRKAERAIHEKIYVISGEQEGRFAAQGVAWAVPGLSGVVCDLGGGSLELAVVENGRFQRAMTLPLGALRLAANRDRLDAYIGRHLDSVPESYAGQDTLYLVGGSFRAFARAHARLHDRPGKNLDGYRLDKNDVSALRRGMGRAGVRELVNDYGIDPERADTMPHVGILAEQLIKRLGARRAVVTTAGVRHGVLLELKKFGKIRNDGPQR